MATHPNRVLTKSPWGESRRQRENQFPQKREALLNAAAALFRKEGYAGASLNDLADILNITKPTLYYYVHSKDQLLFEIVTRGQDDVLTFIRKAHQRDGTGYEKLRRIMIHYAEVIISDYGACMLLMRPVSLESKLNTQIRARLDEANGILYAVLSEGKKDGTLSFEDPIVALHAMFGSLNWLSRWYDRDGKIPPEKYVPLHVDTVLEGVKTGRGRPPNKASVRSPSRRS